VLQFPRLPLVDHPATESENMKTDSKPAPHATRPLRLVKETVRNLTAQPGGSKQAKADRKTSEPICSYEGCN
jgi:hypothetical protein